MIVPDPHMWAAHEVDPVTMNCFVEIAEAIRASHAANATGIEPIIDLTPDVIVPSRIDPVSALAVRTRSLRTWQETVEYFKEHGHIIREFYLHSYDPPTDVYSEEGTKIALSPARMRCACFPERAI